MNAGVAIRSFEESDLDAVVAFSLREWEPVFESLRRVLGDPIFGRLHDPDWRAVQAEAVRSNCTSKERDVFVAVVDGRPVGFAAVALDGFTRAWESWTSSRSTPPTSAAASRGS